MIAFLLEHFCNRYFKLTGTQTVLVGATLNVSSAQGSVTMTQVFK
jgi:hypothetical protein